MINDRLSRLLTVREKDDSNLVLMFDILFRFLAVDFGKDVNTTEGCARARRRTGGW